MEHQRVTRATRAEPQREIHTVTEQVLLTQSRAHPVLYLQRMIGNQRMQSFIQAKLEVVSPFDKYEQEADRVSEQVLSMKATKEAPPIQDAAGSSALMNSVSPIVQNVLSSSGHPLDPKIKAFMESRFGHDFNQVRIHTDAQAAESTRSMNSLAYTMGYDIFFGMNKYAPTTSTGQKLLAHELAYVVQQSQQPRHNDHMTLMRAVSAPPSSEVLQKEIAALQERLAHLAEQNPGVSTPEMIEVQKMLESKQALAGENDPIRQRILFYRASLRELRKQLAAAPLSSSPERETLRQSIREYEIALAGALDTNIQRLDNDIGNLRKNFEIDPALQDSINAAESELIQNEAERKTLSMIFSPEKATALARTYAKEVTPEIAERCMGAFYKGLGALYTPAEAAAIRGEAVAASQQYDIAHRVPRGERGQTYSVDRIMNAVRAHSKAGPMMTFKYNARTKAWSPNVEQTILGLASSDCPGLYAFGLSLHGAYHSVILVVDTSQGGAPKINWMDQYATGFSNQYEKEPFTDKNNVTGKLEEKMKLIEPGYGFSDTKIWQLIPSPEIEAEGIPGE